MILKQLRLQNFRNYKNREFRFSSGTTLILGPNTSGKTNILEAICLLATGKSFRAGVEKEMISYGEEIARVSVEVTHQNFGVNPSLRRTHGFTAVQPATVRGVLPTETTTLEIVLTRGQIRGERVPKKQYIINGIKKRMMDFVGNLRCVLFGPEDLEIVVNSPSIRRDWLDSVLVQVDRNYRRAILSYKKGLRQRNKLLEQIRDKGRSRSALFFWNKLLLENGEIISQKREEFIDFINAQPDYFYDLNVSYQKNLISPARLEKYEEQEIAIGATLVGPHRDDFELRVKGKSLHAFGSRGEQRIAVFSLKLAELEFMAEKSGDSSTGSGQGRPVLLLDDIFSELDHGRRKRLIEIIPKQQTIITATDIHLIEPAFRRKVKIIELK